MRSAEPDRIGQRPSRTGEIERVFTEVAPGLWRTIYAFSAGRAAVADDAVAEAFARALERSDEIRDLKPWLYRTAFRIASAELKRERRGQPTESGPAAVTAPEGLSALVPALRQLSPAQRAAVVLHYEADLPVRDVARQLGTSVAVVKVHLFRGRNKLRELLGDAEVDDA
jgi:RNA polymerase sigma-70 factor, ECF subfamily